MRCSFLFFLLFLLATRPLPAQVAADTLHPATAGAGFDAARTRLDQRGMAVLGGWAVGNLLVGTLGTGQTEGSAHYFHQMNAGWGAVNLALAALGYQAARRAAHAPARERAAVVRGQLRTENLYLFNAGLDAAYLATGLYLLEKSRNPTAAEPPERWRGYGQSLLLQGGFLLLFDGLQYAAHHRHGTQKLYPLLSGISIGPGVVVLSLPLTDLFRPAHRLPTRHVSAEPIQPQD